MSEGFKHPKSKVHVGDGFKFLDDYKNTFDVIITDSSDPEGPAESLFQKPYFQLLHDALREGGVITTQGCMSHLLKKVETWEEFPLSPGEALRVPDPALRQRSGGYRVVVRLGFPMRRRFSLFALSQRADSSRLCFPYSSCPKQISFIYFVRHPLLPSPEARSSTDSCEPP
jgi:hypothetical protein